MKKHLMIGVTALLLFVGSLSHAARQYNSVEAMVRDQKVIRLMFDWAPGYGNQAATINVMNRLWQMQFQGSFELIYPDRPEDTQKVINLFNLPANLPPVYRYEDKKRHKILFIAETEFIKQRVSNTVEAFTLGITGAYDEHVISACDSVPECEKYARNFADFTNTDVFVILSPWFRENYDAIQVRNVKGRIPVSPHGQFHVYPVADLDDASRYLTDDPDGQALLREKPALKVLIAGITSKAFNMMPVYGYTFLKKYHEMRGSIYPQNILQVITGARYAQLFGSAEMQKPMIIPVFYDYMNDAKELDALMQSDNWGEYEEQGGDQMRAAINMLGLKKPNTFLLAALSDNDAIRKIQSLQPGQILLLSMGPLPKIVFDGIYAHDASNVWPQMREGEGSLSMLILRGHPQLRCEDYFPDQDDDKNYTKWEPEFNLVKGDALKLRLQTFYGRHGFCARHIWITHPDIYKDIGQFIIESRDANSAFSKYFSDLRYEAYKPENDRIHRGLEEAMNEYPNKFWI